MGVLDVEHRLRFQYDEFIQQSWMELRVEPRSSPHQTVHSFYLAVGPPTVVGRYLDWNQNWVHHFGVADYHDRIDVVTRSLVDVHPDWPELSELRELPAAASGRLIDFASFGGPVVRSRALEELDAGLGLERGAPLGEQIDVIGRSLRERFRYQPGVTDFRSSSDHVLEEGVGVCQDFAHLMLALLRLRGIASRYVSGYLHVDRLDQEPSQSHAWIEFHSAARGWVGYDPTHARVPNEDYVAVARGRHYDDAAPNRGVFRGSAGETLSAHVRSARAGRPDVAGLHEQIEEIDVPVYRELPAVSRRDRMLSEEQPPDSQQQQQQQ